MNGRGKNTKPSVCMKRGRRGPDGSDPFARDTALSRKTALSVLI
jgi:hypothetical protein